MAKEQPITYRLVYLKIDKYKNIEDIEVKFTLDYEIEESIEAAALLIKEIWEHSIFLQVLQWTWIEHLTP